MGRKHYSGKELLHQRQMEKQRQQGGSQTIRQRVQEMNRLKKSVEAAKQGMRKRAREGESNANFD